MLFYDMEETEWMNVLYFHTRIYNLADLPCTISNFCSKCSKKLFLFYEMIDFLFEGLSFTIICLYIQIQLYTQYTYMYVIFPFSDFKSQDSCSKIFYLSVTLYSV